MKQIVAITFALFLTTACKKETSLYNRFSGKWEYEKFVGYPSSTNNSLPPGNGRFILLMKDGTFERRQHDSLLYRGKYFLKTTGPCPQTGNLVFFSTDENSHSDQIIRIERTKLNLSTFPCYADGGVTIYRKVEER